MGCGCSVCFRKSNVAKKETSRVKVPTNLPPSIYLPGVSKSHESLGVSNRRRCSSVISLAPEFSANVSTRCNDVINLTERLMTLGSGCSLDEQLTILQSIEYLRDYCIPTLARDDELAVENEQRRDSKANFWYKSFTGYNEEDDEVEHDHTLQISRSDRFSSSRNDKRKAVDSIFLRQSSKNEDWWSGYLNEHIMKWEFDTFEFSRLTKRHAITVLFRYMMIKTTIAEEFKIDLEKLNSYTMSIEQGYRRYNNPYHNEIHGADVLQVTYSIINISQISKWLSSLEVLAMLFAAMVHDVEHTGTNNVFHQQVQSELAMLYNDKSVLENHHASVAFKLLALEENFAFTSLHSEQFKQFRRIAIDCILATDMASHFNQVRYRISKYLFDEIERSLSSN